MALNVRALSHHLPYVTRSKIFVMKINDLYLSLTLTSVGRSSRLGVEKTQPWRNWPLKSWQFTMTVMEPTAWRTLGSSLSSQLELKRISCATSFFWKGAVPSCLNKAQQVSGVLQADGTPLLLPSKSLELDFSLCQWKSRLSLPTRFSDYECQMLSCS